MKECIAYLDGEENWHVVPHEELIRCRDCIYFDGYYCHNKYWGDGYGNYTPPIKKEDGYCDWAERKEKHGND